MNIIEQNVERYYQSYDLDGILMHIERCAHTAYKSYKAITPESARLFVNKMLKLGHYSVLEHGVVYITVKEDNKDIIEFFSSNPYSIVLHIDGIVYITTNYRVIIENEVEQYLEYSGEPTLHTLRYTFGVTTNRAIANEIVRHRTLSFTQESTRYCDYSSDKFNGITFIKPELSNYNFEQYLQSVEDEYYKLLETTTPEIARDILPLCTKTDIVISGDINAFKHFFDLRLDGKTGRPHPQVQQVAGMMYDNIYSNV